MLIFRSNEKLPVVVGFDMFDTDFLAVIFIGCFFFVCFLHAVVCEFYIFILMQTHSCTCVSASLSSNEGKACSSYYWPRERSKYSESVASVK